MKRIIIKRTIARGGHGVKGDFYKLSLNANELGPVVRLKIEER